MQSMMVGIANMTASITIDGIDALLTGGLLK